MTLANILPRPTNPDFITENPATKAIRDYADTKRVNLLNEEQARATAAAIAQEQRDRAEDAALANIPQSPISNQLTPRESSMGLPAPMDTSSSANVGLDINGGLGGADLGMPAPAGNTAFRSSLGGAAPSGLSNRYSQAEQALRRLGHGTNALNMGVKSDAARIAEAAVKDKQFEEVLKLAAGGETEAAKMQTRRWGINDPELAVVIGNSVMAKALLWAKHYGYTDDPPRKEIFLNTMKETGGDVEASRQAAGTPVKRELKTVGDDLVELQGDKTTLRHRAPPNPVTPLFSTVPIQRPDGSIGVGRMDQRSGEVTDTGQVMAPKPGEVLRDKGATERAVIRQETLREIAANLGLNRLEVARIQALKGQDPKKQELEVRKVVAQSARSTTAGGLSPQRQEQEVQRILKGLRELDAPAATEAPTSTAPLTDKLPSSSDSSTETMESIRELYRQGKITEEEAIKRGGQVIAKRRK